MFVKVDVSFPRNKDSTEESEHRVGIYGGTTIVRRFWIDSAPARNYHPKHTRKSQLIE
jgi:hypothetical protein